MTFKEKLDKFCEYESYDFFSDDDIELIGRLSYDMNSFIRALSAETLARIQSVNSKNILFRLANDKNCFVRTEAYDSLSVFCEKEVAEFLSKKIVVESDDLARSYAITSFAQVCKATGVLSSEIEFLASVSEKMKSERCLLCMFYALYVFGKEEYLGKIYSFLHSNNYRIICTAVSLLGDIINYSNSKDIIDEVKKVDNNSIAVQSRVRSFLDEYG